MKKVVFFLAIVTVSAEGMNNGFTPNSQPNANGRITRILTINSTSEGRPNDGRNAFITPPTSPQSGSNINRVVTPFNPEERSNSNRLTTIYENQPHSNTIVSQNQFITAQNAMPVLQSLNEQNSNFVGRRVQSQSYTTRGSMVVPYRPSIQNYAGQVPQFIHNIIPTRQSIFNQQIRLGNNGNIVRTRISFYITTYVETAMPPVPQYIGTYPNNFAQNFQLQPQSQFSQNFTQQPQEYRRVDHKRKASEDAETLTVKKVMMSNEKSSEKDRRQFSDTQSHSKLMLDSASQNNDSNKGWLNTLYNSLMQPDYSEASTSQVADSVNETELSSDECDNIPLSQIRNLKKRKSNSSDAHHCTKKRNK